ncbi:hypothetical protein R3W88_022079 [Solanum pinnatisectum]|uniref:Uncharacterized protein n=1 Tax=Solanum pinnatisectum TaxID=50273 RepID=A0AAV9LTM2_9SOLN|nr:hypothetical protein R3W88_022079 [Solanum pinnatisectum]
MNCIFLPVSNLKRHSSIQLDYQLLFKNNCRNTVTDHVTVMVGKDKREFLVESFVKKEDRRKANENKENKVIFVDVDAILFEHMLWLMQNDCSSFQLNLKEIIDFYCQRIVKSYAARTT